MSEYKAGSLAITASETYDLPPHIGLEDYFFQRLWEAGAPVRKYSSGDVILTKDGWYLTRKEDLCSCTTTFTWWEASA